MVFIPTHPVEPEGKVTATVCSPTYAPVPAEKVGAARAASTIYVSAIIEAGGIE